MQRFFLSYVYLKSRRKVKSGEKAPDLPEGRTPGIGDTIPGNPENMAPEFW